MFHVEVSHGIRRARVFNLDREDLVEKVLQPWLENRRVTMGEREWVPRDSALRILEGPRLETPDLAFGQGWSNAERASQEVTGEMLRSAPAPRAPDAFAIESEAPEALAAELASGAGGAPVPWPEAREMIDGRDPRVAAVIVVLRRGAGA